MITGTLAAATTSADWAVTVEVTDYVTEALIDLTGVTEITVRVEDPSSKAAVLSTTLTAGGVTITGTGVFTFSFTAAQMSGVAPGTYNIGATMVDTGSTIQVLIGQLPVLDGIV